MPKKTFTPEQIVAKLRQIEVPVSLGTTIPQACKEVGIVERTFCRWRKEYGGLQVEQALHQPTQRTRSRSSGNTPIMPAARCPRA